MTMRLRYLNLNLQAAARVGFGGAMMAGTRQGRLTADLPARIVRRAKRTGQERCGSSDTSWSLSAIRPSSGSALALRRWHYSRKAGGPMWSNGIVGAATTAGSNRQRQHDEKAIGVGR
jgi:hypothetical protein